MKIPERYIEELNKIIENQENYSSVELFYAYTKLWSLKDVFRHYGMTSENEEYDRLLDALVSIEIKVAVRLRVYQEQEKWRVKWDESES